MNILEKIIASKKAEIAQAKAEISVAELEKSELFVRNILSVTKSIHEKQISIIAEHKRQSPSKGIINNSHTVEFVTQGYAQAGAACLSVLTDAPFFGGTLQDLKQARMANPNTPILRKDFIIDTYQILEAKSCGADVILLIASNLEVSQCIELAKFAQQVGLEVLLEVHNANELHRYLNPYINLVGVNNRNLKTFEVNIETSLQLAEHIPDTVIKVAESGLNSAHEIAVLAKAGYKAFLIGESFMKTDNPGAACAKLIKQAEEELAN